MLMDAAKASEFKDEINEQHFVAIYALNGMR